MLFKYLSLATGLAATTVQAFLIPPELTVAEIDEANAVAPLIVEASASHTDLQLDCFDCDVVIQRPGGFVKIKGPFASHLDFNFTIERSENGDGDRLLLNDFELYPTSDSLVGSLGAKHTPHFPEREGPRNYKILKTYLGFALRTKTLAKDEANQEVIRMDLQIIEVGGKFVKGIPNVVISLVRHYNHLFILRVEKSESETAAPASSKPKECSTALCRWKALINRLSSIKPFKHCGGKMRHGGKSHHDGHQGHHGHHWDKPHHAGNGEVMEAHHHTWLQLAKNVASHILLPALIGIFIGIVVGILASLLGMMVSKLVVYLWRCFFRGHSVGRRHCHRRHNSGHACHRAVQKEDGAAEEKSGLIHHQEPPPSYTDDETPNKV